MLMTYKFDHARQVWDDYGAFYNNYQGFIILSTGERFYTKDAPKPGSRHFYRELGVTITSTTDEKCPDLYHKNKKVPKAWLTQNGCQYLAIDHEHGRAVRLMSCSRYWRGGRHDHTNPPAGHEGIPSHLHHRYAVYWGGEHALPLGKPITLSPPLVLTKEQKDDLQSLIDSIHAWLALKDIEAHAWASKVQIDGKQVAVPGGPQEPVRYYLGKTMADMSYEQRLKLVTRGYMSARDAHHVPYLTIKS